MFYWVTWFFVKIIRGLFFPIRVYGIEHIPSNGAFILASNHRSYLDPMIIPILIKRRISFVAKKSLFDNRLLSWILTHLEAFPIRRGTADFRAIRQILSRLKRGMPVLIFPEGTRLVGQKKQKVQAGIGMIVAKSRVPIVPVYIDGSDNVLPPGAKFPKRKRVIVRFGKPFHITAIEGKSYQKIAEEIMGTIESLARFR